MLMKTKLFSTRSGAIMLAALALLAVLILQSGCAVDTALRQIDRMCNAETKTKAEYRKCLEDQYTDFKSAVGIDKAEEAVSDEESNDDEI